jgi:hypothetical protein
MGSLLGALMLFQSTRSRHQIFEPSTIPRVSLAGFIDLDQSQWPRLSFGRFNFIFRHPMTDLLSELDRRLARLFDILGASTVRRYGVGVPEKKN